MADLIGVVYLSSNDIRFVVYNRNSEPVARKQTAYARSAPREGWVECDPVELWRGVETVVHDVLAETGMAATDLAAIGVANHRETTVVWNRSTGRPYHPAIAATDRRAAGLMAQIELDGQGEAVRKKTGLVPDALFSAGKLRWLLDNVDGLRADAERGEALFGTTDSWLLWNLTGQHVTDITNASRTLLMNLETEDWDDELLTMFDVPRAMLPAIRSSSDAGGFGTTALSGPFGAELPVTGVLGEHQAALVGQHCFAPGTARYGFEASSVLLVHTGTIRMDAGPRALSTVAYRFGDAPTVYALEALVPCTGATIQWLVDGLGIIRGVGEIEAMSRRTDDPEGMYFVPAFAGLSIPAEHPGARAVFVGMDLHHNQNHVARATLQGLAYQLRDVLEVIRVGTGLAPRMLRVDGNGAWFDMCMQIHSDVVGAMVSRPMDVADPAALGACYAAGLAVGWWRDLAEVAAMRRENHRWSPQWMDADRESGYAGWHAAVERTYGWVDESTVPRGDRLATQAAVEWSADGSR